MRTAEFMRKTGETDIFVKLNIDGTGVSKIDSGCGFLDHMLTLFSKHSRIDLEVSCKGDVEVDYHHTVEDVGIAIGAAIDHAMNFRRDGVKGIRRYGNMILPMDETLILSAIPSTQSLDVKTALAPRLLGAISLFSPYRLAFFL